MCSHVESSRSRGMVRVAAVALIAGGLAACSSDTTRFGDSPFANPFQARTSAPAPSEVTGSVPPAQRAPVGRVEAQPLPSYQATQTLPPPTRPAMAANGTSGGGRGIASYQPSPSPEVTGSLPPPPAAAPSATGASNWNWDGGTAVSAAPGDTVDGLSRRYGVPSAAILQANNLSAGAALQPGQRIVIPRYNAAVAPAASAPATRVASNAPMVPARAAVPPPAAGGVHVVAPGETLSKIARLYRKSRPEIARANNITPDAKVIIGQKLVIPGTQAAPVRTANARPALPAAKPATKPVAVAAVAPKPVVPAAPTRAVATSRPTAIPAAVVAQPQGGAGVNSRIAAAEPPATARVAAPAAEPSIEQASGSSAEATGSTPSFRWPVRGRIITAFGPKPNGQQNDGINLAVPEGTSVKASEDGVVAYAGSELKGYGNLVLVRHAGGFVTAYAHASELMVKRGDTVKRGQIIARAGQTGTVSSPQLHFEIRKGKDPVDPTRYLAGT